MGLPTPEALHAFEVVCMRELAARRVMLKVRVVAKLLGASHEC